MKNLIKLLVIMCLFTGCKKTPNTDDCKKTIIVVDSGNKTLIGQWSWVLTYVLSSYPCNDTPENTGIEELFVLNTDSTWIFYRNEQVISEGDSIFVGKYYYDDEYDVNKRIYSDSIVFYKNGSISNVEYIKFNGGNYLQFVPAPGCTGGVKSWKRNN